MAPAVQNGDRASLPQQPADGKLVVMTGGQLGVIIPDLPEIDKVCLHTGEGENQRQHKNGDDQQGEDDVIAQQHGKQAPPPIPPFQPCTLPL